MHIDTSSIADRINHLRPSASVRPEPFDQAAIKIEQVTSRTDASEDVATKRKSHLAMLVSHRSTVLRDHQRQEPKPLTREPAQQPGLRAVQDQPENPINALLADWGKSDSNYDLNNDGTVNTEDLLLLLAKLSAPDKPVEDAPELPKTQSEPIPTPVVPEPSTDLTPKPVANLATPTPVDPEPPTDLTPKPVANPPTTDSTLKKPENRIDALLADWGKSDSPYDLNKDGTVSTQDLLMLLNKIADATSQTVDKDDTIVPVASSSDGPLPPDVNAGKIVSEAPINNPIQSLLNDWGKADSPYDYNGDGTVTTADLLMLLSKLSQSDESAGDEVPKIEQSLSSLPNKQRIADFSTIEDAKPMIQQIAKGLAERLLNRHEHDGNISIKEAGEAKTIFRSIDTNGDTQIDKLELTNKIQNMLMERLTQYSPANLNKFISETMQLFTSRSETHTSINRAYQRVDTDQAANQLAQRLANTGEVELRGFLNNTDFSTSEKKSILSQLHNLNLGTLGVNVVG